jgi:hypothetical protein
MTRANQEKNPMNKPRLSAPGLMVCLLAAGVASVAQTANEPRQAAPLAEVIVTGSRIPVPANIIAASPWVAVTAQDITLYGRTDISDLLDTLALTLVDSGVDFGDTVNPLPTNLNPALEGQEQTECTISRNGSARFRANEPTLHGLPAEPQLRSSTRPFSLRQVFWL